MCNFFRLYSDCKVNPMYFDWDLRKKILDETLEGNYTPDSHTSIADYFGYKAEKEDTLNKYEYNPLTKVFKVDQLNTTDDSKQIEKFCRELDFKKIVPQLIVKPIIHPFKDRKCDKVTKEDLKLLKKWVSVRVSARRFAGYSILGFVGVSVWVFVRDSVWDFVGGSMRDSVGYSVWDSVVAYMSSFFKIDKWKGIKRKKGVNPFQSGIDLWEKGLVPIFDGKVWRLHSYKGIIWEEKI